MEDRTNHLPRNARYPSPPSPEPKPWDARCPSCLENHNANFLLREKPGVPAFSKPTNHRRVPSPHKTEPQPWDARCPSCLNPHFPTCARLIGPRDRHTCTLRTRDVTTYPRCNDLYSPLALEALPTADVHASRCGLRPHLRHTAPPTGPSGASRPSSDLKEDDEGKLTPPTIH